MTRWFAVGDPQTTFERFLGILRGHALLDERERLRGDVGLVSIGDHFDFFASTRSLADVAQDGVSILEWLAQHPPEQVVIMLGNHDAARVMELAFESDETFARAREVAAKESKDAFTAAFPRIPTPGIAQRDYSSFTVAQRALVQSLLLSNRFRLGIVARREGASILVTHAGVTTRELGHLALGEEATAEATAAALEDRLRSAVDRVRDAWVRGEPAPLDLAPLHAAGGAGEEGGGLLYHRPSTKPRDDWSSAGPAPRRFHPSKLPRGLVQACGHTGHHKCREEFAVETSAAARGTSRGGLRTLTAGPRGIAYDLGISAPRADEATLYMIDIEMNHADVVEHPLLALDDVISS